MKEDPDLLDQSRARFSGDPHKFDGHRPEDVDVENFPDELVPPGPKEDDPEEEGQDEDQEEETSGEGEPVDSEDTASNVNTNNISVSVENSASSPTFFLSGFPGMNTSLPMGQNFSQQGQMSSVPQTQAPQQQTQPPAQSLPQISPQSAISAPITSSTLPSNSAIYSSPPVASFSSPAPQQMMSAPQQQSYLQSSSTPATMVPQQQPMQQTYQTQATVSSPVTPLSPMSTAMPMMMATPAAMAGAAASVPQSRPTQTPSENLPAPTSTPAAKPQVSIPAGSTPVAVAARPRVPTQSRMTGSPLTAALGGFNRSVGYPTMYSSRSLRPAARSGSILGRQAGILTPATAVKTPTIGRSAVSANPFTSLP